MKKPYCHNEIEVNYLPECSITYIINNCKFKVQKGSAIAFWSLMPHQIVGFNKDCPYYVINIPFSILNKWKLPKAFLDNLFRGDVQTMTNLEVDEFEKKRFNKWNRELEQNDAELYSACLPEICDYLKRFAFKSLSAQTCLHKVEPAPNNLVETMAMFIANNFTEPIKVSDVAKEVGLHPDYANSIFKKAIGSTICNYIMDQRVLYAQRKLTNTDDSITSLAYQSGFNSICRFNAAFKKKSRLTPREYRKSHLRNYQMHQL
jgi:AraC-like DNA-binding protein